jgi:ketosteroid isomerase-like protein
MKDHPRLRSRSAAFERRYFMSAPEAAVLAANAAFYEAFAKRDILAMDTLWAKHAKVACIHPGWDVLSGRARVMASFRAILEGPTPPDVQFTRASAHILGVSAFVTCIEVLPRARLIATNVFTLEEDEWKLVHHQAGPVAQQFNVVGGAPPESLN